MQVIPICSLFTVMAQRTSEQWVLVTGGKGNDKGRKQVWWGRILVGRRVALARHGRGRRSALAGLLEQQAIVHVGFDAVTVLIQLFNGVDGILDITAVGIGIIGVDGVDVVLHVALQALFRLPVTAL